MRAFLLLIAVLFAAPAQAQHSCRLDGTMVMHGLSIMAFTRSTVRAPDDCKKYERLRTCWGGQLDGDVNAGHRSCTIIATEAATTSPAVRPVSAVRVFERTQPYENALFYLAVLGGLATSLTLLRIRLWAPLVAFAIVAFGFVIENMFPLHQIPNRLFFTIPPWHTYPEVAVGTHTLFRFTTMLGGWILITAPISFLIRLLVLNIYMLRDKGLLQPKKDPPARPKPEPAPEPPKARPVQPEPVQEAPRAAPNDMRSKLRETMFGNEEPPKPRAEPPPRTEPKPEPGSHEPQGRAKVKRSNTYEL